ncbi:molybdopterin-synthase adenylyltransferase MoeB [Candidatus Enterovibrio escicola]|uniref:Molybdopterin-synthase adenylyltransferase n=1 Tax=Candidatus Enterovibrio escicola TaxID=1927127 RepID=A0A2A5T0Z4_9GAMM|nr:molybdopterin-synthase adenylyltransferase MoeB [Candidatus Enterovibrio escacola]PCS21835.1 Molybdopterin biosynthesis protein MoeB [Candidatus Enterovibrio escacola]
MDILSSEEELRYNRQISLKKFDFYGQEALKKSSTLILGLGGLGCTASQYLAAAGAGTLTLVDNDFVELSNLQRQILHNDSTIGKLKVVSAAKALRQLNPHVQVNIIAQRLADEALSTLIAKHSLVLDCSDNIETRNQLNRLCFSHKTPLVNGAVIRLEGQVSVFTYSKNEPCYRCLSTMFGDQESNCTEMGILSPVVGIIGAMQALEAIKVISRFSPLPSGKLMMFDAMDSKWHRFTILKNAYCSVCNN